MAVIAVLCGITGFWAGSTAHGVLAGWERDTLTTSLDRRRRELASVREQLGQAIALVDELERRVERDEIVIDDAQGAVHRAVGIGNELEALDGSTGERLSVSDQSLSWVMEDAEMLEASLARERAYNARLDRSVRVWQTVAVVAGVIALGVDVAALVW
jgi:hypothetical protein